MHEFTVGRLLAHRFTAIATTLVCILLTGCSGHDIGGSTTPPASAPSLSDAEIHYGVSPTRNSQVTYQDDVIVMEHGAEAIRSTSADGLTYMIDANAPHAGEIQPDKILFATGRVVGRVLAVARNGSDVAVTLGPAELTDIIKEADITYQGALDPDKMITYIAPADYPGTHIDLDEPAQASANRETGEVSIPATGLWSDAELASLHSAQLRTRIPECADPHHKHRGVYVASELNSRASGRGCATTPTDILIDQMHFFPDLSHGLGVTEKFNESGMKFIASAKLRIDHPYIKFNLVISNGRLKTAAVELGGVGGMDLAFEGGTSAEFDKNINRGFELPLDISFPIAGVGLPLAATFHQSILIHTMFTVKGAVLKATGQYDLSGKITAGIVDGKLDASAPVFIEGKSKLANGLSGSSLGVNGLVLGYSGKLIVGLGAYSFVVGPYISASITGGVTRGSDMQVGLVGYTCRIATAEMWLDYGIGFAVPTWTVKALNAFIGLFHAKPVQASYGTRLGTKKIYQSDEAIPPSCAAKPP